MTIAAVCLALAIDVSGSISPEHFRLQAHATADALESPAVVRAARDGLATTVIFFGGQARVVVAPSQDPRQVAHALRQAERNEAGATNVAAAIRVATSALLAQDCERRVTDISGDGRHNSGDMAEVVEAVSMATAAGIEINCLPVVTRQEPDVAEWFQENVCGPAGGFVVPAEWASFDRAIRYKLSNEVASR